MKPILIAFIFIVSVSYLTGFKYLQDPAKPIHSPYKYQAEYEVQFIHTGYILLSGTLEDCPIRPSGKVILKGRLSGVESSQRSDDPILYTGILDLNIDMDICSVKRLPNGEDKICGMTVKGNGRVKAELELDTAGRMAYIKFNYDSTTHGRFQKSVGGTCDQPQQAEEEYMTPNETIASIFNGRDLPMLLNHRTLRVGRYVERDGRNETVVEVLRKIR